MQFVKSVIVSIFGKQKIPYSLNAKKSKEQKENTDIMSITLPFNIYVHLSWKERDRVKEKKSYMAEIQWHQKKDLISFICITWSSMNYTCVKNKDHLACMIFTKSTQPLWIIFDT